MGLDNRHVFALAMALSLAVVAVAGVLLAVRTNFDPAIGPARLIFGFEAVIIGGLGSMWGTLAGGIILGVAQAIGAQIDPGWQLLAGHIAFLVILARAARGPVPEGAGMSADIPRRACQPVEPDRHWRLFAIALVGARRGAVAGAAATICGCSSEIYAYVALASLWNLLAGYAGLVSVGQQAYVGLGAYVLFGADHSRRRCPRSSPCRSPASIAAVDRAAGRGSDVPAARPLLRHRHLGRRRGLPAPRVADLGARRRLRHQPAGRHRDRDGLEPADARIPDLLDRAGARWSSILAAIVLLLRSRYGLALTAIRDNELAARSNGIDVTRIKFVVYVADRVRHRDGRRADLPAEAAHLPRHRLQRQRLDRVRDLHHRDRRHRPDRGADHRYDRILPAAADAGRSRQRSIC